jgi:hypothetical protein
VQRGGETARCPSFVPPALTQAEFSQRENRHHSWGWVRMRLE